MERYPLSEDIAAHNHDFIEMAYVLEGTVQHSSNGKERGAAGHEIASLWGSPLFHRRSHSFLARNGQRTVCLLRFRGGD